MDTVNEVLSFAELEKAKQFAFDVVKESASARQTNTDKANSMINNASSVKNLAMAITNFMLAHPSENLKSIR